MRDFSDWIGRSEERRDELHAWPAAALHAALDRPGDPPLKGDPLPPLWRWLYFLDASPGAALGRDGHRARGDTGLTPPIPEPRRMWAGGRFAFKRPLLVGQRATKHSTLMRVARKDGAAGPMTLVTIGHEILTADGSMETEEQDIVYVSGAPDAARAKRVAPPEDAPWRRVRTADEALLFRYSALTYNAHRIHYDIDYCREAEGYPALVVHGPLLATLMLELLRERGPDRRIESFEYRALAPVFHTDAFEVCAKPVTTEDGRDGAETWVAARSEDGLWGARLAMRGAVVFGDAPRPR